MRILFLYTELANYFVACCKELSKQAEVHIVRWPVNKEAPFDFDFTGLHVYTKTDFTYAQLKAKVAFIKPDVIVCSGWVDEDYKKIAALYKGKIPTVVAFDTHWRGDLKQYVLRLMAPFYLHRLFSHAWVPGEIQKKYALKLGFNEQVIETGFYSCDVNYFNAVYNETFASKRSNFPKRFLFVGRYYQFKGIKELWQAFIELQSETPNEWELWCAGNGDVEPVKHPRIKHLGFVQPKEMNEVLQGTGVFVLPSHFEPWGLVVHEHAAAGFPLLLSSNIGAATTFLTESKNGFMFESHEISDIKRVLKQIISLNSSELIKMGEVSHNAAQKINPEAWVKQVLNFKIK